MARALLLSRVCISNRELKETVILSDMVLFTLRCYRISNRELKDKGPRGGVTRQTAASQIEN